MPYYIVSLKTCKKKSDYLTTFRANFFGECVEKLYIFIKQIMTMMEKGYQELDKEDADRDYKLLGLIDDTIPDKYAIDGGHENTIICAARYNEDVDSEENDKFQSTFILFVCLFCVSRVIFF
jgi:hypothetical protein